MRVLLDENLPRGLRQDLIGHDMSTVAEIGWSGLDDAELLRRSAQRFDALVTADRNLEFQQNIAAARLGIIVVEASNTRLQTLRPLVPAILAALGTLELGTVVHVRGQTSEQSNVPDVDDG